MSVSFFHTTQSFIQFLWNWKLSDGKLVDQNTANLRAAICAQCHNNQPSGDVRKSGCGVCNKGANWVVDKARDTIVNGARTSSDDKLLACAICGCDNKISVWIPNHFVLKLEEADAFPQFCWKKKIKENLEV